MLDEELPEDPEDVLPEEEPELVFEVPLLVEVLEDVLLVVEVVDDPLLLDVDPVLP